MEITAIRNKGELGAFLTLEGAPPLQSHAPSVQDADEHCLVCDDDGTPLARCSLWYTSVPAYPPHTLGLIGHYAARDGDAAALLLETASASLAAHNCTLAVGPIDGSTFRHYRFVTDRAPGGFERPPFFLEPDNPDAWPLHLVAAGFYPMATYVSAQGRLPAVDPRLNELEERAADAGITVRQSDLEAFASELTRIYEIVVDSFQDNLLYAPICRQEFLAQYGQVRPYIRPENVFIAEQAGAPVGFIFALPDLAQRSRGESVDTLIVKTLAVRPHVAGHGLGSLLAARVHAAAYASGYRNVIHALMHETNRSRTISGHYADVMRRYTLYSKQLSG